MKKCILLAFAILAFSGSVFATITSDFQTWLNANGYGSYDFARTDLGANGSYGGRLSPGDTVVNRARDLYPREFGRRSRQRHGVYRLDVFDQLFCDAGL